MGEELEELAKRIGARIRHFRKLNGLTQQDLADLAGLGSGSRVSDYERGGYRIGLEVLLRFSKALNVSLSDLFCFDAEAIEQIDMRVLQQKLNVLHGKLEQAVEGANEVKRQLSKLIHNP